jgi:cathepsin L
MDSSSYKFKLYEKGIIEVEAGDCNFANHAVTGVGYFNNDEGEGFIIRNTWGTWWGENGNFRIRYQPNINESCFISNSVYRPEVEKWPYSR